MSKILSAPINVRAKLIGNCFVHPVFDYLLIGGGLSLVVAALVYLKADLTISLSAGWLPAFILLSNSAHFASSRCVVLADTSCWASLINNAGSSNSIVRAP